MSAIAPTRPDELYKKGQGLAAPSAPASAGGKPLRGRGSGGRTYRVRGNDVIDAPCLRKFNWGAIGPARIPSSFTSLASAISASGSLISSLVISTIRQHTCVEPADFAGPATPERIWRAMNDADQR